MKKLLLKRIGYLMILALVGCGVKGDPQPPSQPPMIGHGEPNYTKNHPKLKLKSESRPDSLRLNENQSGFGQNKTAETISNDFVDKNQQ